MVPNSKSPCPRCQRARDTISKMFRPSDVSGWGSVWDAMNEEERRSANKWDLILGLGIPAAILLFGSIFGL